MKLRAAAAASLLPLVAGCAVQGPWGMGYDVCGYEGGVALELEVLQNRLSLGCTSTPEAIVSPQAATVAIAAMEPPERSCEAEGNDPR